MWQDQDIIPLLRTEHDELLGLLEGLKQAPDGVESFARRVAAHQDLERRIVHAAIHPMAPATKALVRGAQRRHAIIMDAIDQVRVSVGRASFWDAMKNLRRLFNRHVAEAELRLLPRLRRFSAVRRRMLARQFAAQKEATAETMLQTA